MKAPFNFDALSDAAYIRQPEMLAHVVPISPATLWRKCKCGQFPKPVKLSVQVSAWRVGDVRAWLALKATGGKV